MPETLTVSAPATSANLGPGFDALAVALDLSNAVIIRRRPGPLAVAVTGEGVGEVPQDDTNLVCRALAMGLGDLDGLEIECRNRIPFGRGLGSSAATVCAGLVAANALGQLRWSPADILERAATIEGHADNAAACLLGGMVAVPPSGAPMVVPVHPELAFVAVIPAERVSTDAARRALPAQVPLADAATTVAGAIGLTLALGSPRLEDLRPVLTDRLHEPYRAPLVPGWDALNALTRADGCLGVTISGSGPTALLWCDTAAADALAATAERVLTASGTPARARVCRIAPTGVRARWTGIEDTKLERSIG